MATVELASGATSSRGRSQPSRFEVLGDGPLLARFLAEKDQQAFAAIVSRHGPMVLGVCRRILRNFQDAEDAFQATFLVLARKAGSLSRPELLANWLYGVAFRTAQQARAKQARRSHHEWEAASMAAAWSEPEAGNGELREVLDQELFRLPEKYRAPLVLCYLEGKTNEEAARLLGWPPGSMSARLARGREMLRERLAGRRGVLAGALPGLLATHPALAEISPLLADTTVEAAVELAVGKTIPAGLVSPTVRELTDSMLTRMTVRNRWLSRGMTALIITFVLGTAATAAYAIDTVWRGNGGYPQVTPSSGGEPGSGGCPGCQPCPHSQQ
jgi:RNA polymerase sigma factor (sigma-70 family)